MKEISSTQAIALPKREALLQVLFGGLFITLCGFIKIPFYPVPFVLTTFGVALIGLRFSPQKAFFATLTFLLFRTTYAPDWIFTPSVGYLASFPFAAAFISYCNLKGNPLLGLVASQIGIHMIGASLLIPLLGLKGAFIYGAGVFAFSDLLKNLLALTISKKGFKAS